MKVVVLGGAGEMGSRAVEDLAVAPEVERVTNADRDVQRATRVIDRINNPRADLDVVGVDATDHDALVSAIKGYDVAASSLGPFFAFESRLVAAALDAETNYVSICDDWSATLDVFIRFDLDARERGVTVVTGSGASPGLSNVGVKLLADRMDQVEKVDISVFVPMDSSEGEATIQHTTFVYGTTVPVFKGGTMQVLPAGCESRKVEFPRYGRVRVWNVGHSEPVTLPRYFPHLKEINMMMGLGPGTGALVAAGRLGVFKSPRRRDIISKAAVRLMRPESTSEAEGAVRIDVSGTREGRPVTLTGCGTATMRDSTGLALSVGTIMSGMNKLTAKGGGVFAPEGCFEPEAFLEMMAERGIPVFSDLAMTERLVT